MKTSLAGIGFFALLITLSFRQQGSAQFLDESCKTSTPSQPGAWTVVLRNATNFLCAGSLIHRQFVLTAAQCIDGQRSLFVMLGSNLLEKHVYVVAVTKVNVHRLYSRRSGLNDIALVMLSQSVNITDRVRPICILKNSIKQDEANKIRSFKTFGWGLGTGRELINNRAEITIRRFSRIYCGFSPESSNFCGGPSLEGTCGGDVGGPLSTYVTLEDQKDHPVQYGIETFNHDICGGARPYIDVTSYANWIETFVRANEDGKVPQDTKITKPKSPAAEEMPLYSDCGETYLTANIYGPDFMAKGVMITHRFVLSTARSLTEDVSSLRVGVEGLGYFQEMEIGSVYKHPEIDIALLRLRSQLIPEKIMKPICILRRQTVEQSRHVLTVLDIIREETNVKRTFNVASPIEKERCTANLRIQTQRTEICVQTPRANRQVFGIRGNVISQRLTIPGNNATVHPLFGIVKHSKNGINIITDVTSHIDWIASVLSENT